jgi:hypothetical protein
MEAHAAPIPSTRTQSRIGARLAAAGGALYSSLIIVGDDTINPAGEPPGVNDSLAEVRTYLGDADTTSFWAGRYVGLLGLCALLFFAAYVSRLIARADTGRGVLAPLALASGVTAAALQFVAAPAQFAAVHRYGDGIDLEVARALLDVSGAAFILAWFPLAIFVGCMAVAALRDGLLPRWLGIAAAILSAGLLGGLAGQPSDAAFMPYALTFLWLIAASVVLVRRA